MSVVKYANLTSLGFSVDVESGFENLLRTTRLFTRNILVTLNAAFIISIL